jgi:hypothetical protein
LSKNIEKFPPGAIIFGQVMAPSENVPETLSTGYRVSQRKGMQEWSPIAILEKSNGNGASKM